MSLPEPEGEGYGEAEDILNRPLMEDLIKYYYMYNVKPTIVNAMAVAKKLCDDSLYGLCLHVVSLVLSNFTSPPHVFALYPPWLKLIEATIVEPELVEGVEHPVLQGFQDPPWITIIRARDRGNGKDYVFVYGHVFVEDTQQWLTVALPEEVAEVIR